MPKATDAKIPSEMRQKKVLPPVRGMNCKRDQAGKSNHAKRGTVEYSLQRAGSNGPVVLP